MMSPEEEKAALLQFLGTMHGQAKAQDQMIVGNSSFVKPVSPMLQQKFEQALTQQVEHYQQPPQYFQAPQESVITQQQDDLQMQLPLFNQSPPLTSALDAKHLAAFQKDLFGILNKINLNLQDLVAILKKDDISESTTDQ